MIVKIVYFVVILVVKASHNCTDWLQKAQLTQKYFQFLPRDTHLLALLLITSTFNLFNLNNFRPFIHLFEENKRKLYLNRDLYLVIV